MQSVKHSFGPIDLYVTFTGNKILVSNDRKKVIKLLKLALPKLSQLLKNHDFFKKNLNIKRDYKIECSVTFCGRKKIHALNAQFRKKNKPTDVLSFPLFEQLRFWRDFLPPVINLGIFISVER